MGLEIRLEGVRHEYPPTEESAAVVALAGVDLRIPAGEIAVLMGPSGSGKSTLLHLAGAIERPTAGRVFLGPTEISSLDERGLTLLRRRSIGFVFQFFNLIPTFTVRENVSFPLHLLGIPEAEVRQRTARVLEEIGLPHRAEHHPSELSGGEMQRVAIGRAIVHDPDVLLADEPTGNLDTRTGERILDLLTELHARRRPTVLMATHSERAAARGTRIIHVLDGTVAEGHP